MHSEDILSQAREFVNSIRKTGRGRIPAMAAHHFSLFMTEVYYGLNLRPQGDYQV